MTKYVEGIPMLLICPVCGERHIDEGVWSTRPHHTHACQHCGTCWRPAIVPTTGVQFLPGFKNNDGLGDREKPRAKDWGDETVEWAGLFNALAAVERYQKRRAKP